MRLNCAAHEGDLYRLRCLIGAGADPAGVDYNGKSPLVISNLIICFNLELASYFTDEGNNV